MLWELVINKNLKVLNIISQVAGYEDDEEGIKPGKKLKIKMDEEKEQQDTKIDTKGESTLTGKVCSTC